MTTETTTESWSSAWPDALAFAVGLAVAWWAGWKAADLVWSLWLSSLVVGYSIILWTMARPALTIARGAWRDRELVREMHAEWSPAGLLFGGLILLGGGLLVVGFVAFHFGMFHYIHSQFLISFFPLDAAGGEHRGFAGMSTYLEVARRYWWFLPAAFLAERGAFLRQPAVTVDRSVTAAAIAARKAAGMRWPASGMMGPYRDVMRMHVLIIFLGAAHQARLENFAVYALVSAVYFFPWRLLRRPAAAPAAA